MQATIRKRLALLLFTAMLLAILPAPAATAASGYNWAISTNFADRTIEKIVEGSGKFYILDSNAIYEYANPTGTGTSLPSIGNVTDIAWCAGKLTALVEISPGTNYEIYTYSGSGWSVSAPADAIYGQGNRLYVAFRYSGKTYVDEYNNNVFTDRYELGNDTVVIAFMAFYDDDIWFTAHNGLYNELYRDGMETHTGGDLQGISSITLDKDGEMILSSGRGVYLLNGLELIGFEEETVDYVAAVSGGLYAIDGSGNLWYAPYQAAPRPPSPPVQPPAPDPPKFPPEPDSSGKVALTPDDLDRLFADANNGVMVITYDGDYDSLQIDVPLSWFMENLGAALLVYNPGLGLLAITSENLLELASLSYDGGEGGKTIAVRGKELTFYPDTMIAYIVEKGSIKLTVTADDRPLDWYIYDSPVILGLPGDVNDTWVVAEKLADGTEKIIPRSVMRNGLVYALVNSEGLFELKYNEKAFSDIGNNDAENAILFLASRGIISGTGGGMFAPGREANRAEFVTMLMKMMDYQMETMPLSPFSDVKTGDWYNEHVSKAAALGITAGTGGGFFSPHAGISRQDMYTMTYNALVKFYLWIPGETDPGVLGGYADYDAVSAYALRAMEEMIANGLGTGAGVTLDPHTPVTRAEAAIFLEAVIRHIVPDYSEYLAG